MKKCIVCEKEYTPYRSIQKYCSPQCHTQARNQKKKQSYKAGEQKTQTKTCTECNKEFEARMNRTKYCSRTCYFNAQKETRKGKGNPAYRNGTRTAGKTVTNKHLAATRKYRINFVDKHGYKFCEECKINNSLRFETHHIIFASEKPRHKNLHDSRNLIMLCIKCHNNFHSGKTKEKRLHLVRERGLVKLFDKSITL